MKRFLSLLLTAAMLLSLTACGGGSGGGETSTISENLTSEGDTSSPSVTSTGRYVETEITPTGFTEADDIASTNQFFANEDGSLDLVYSIFRLADDTYWYEYHWLHSEDSGESWTEQDIPQWEGNVSLALDGQRNPYGLAIDEEKNDFVIDYQAEDGTLGERRTTLPDPIFLQRPIQDLIFNDHYVLVPTYAAETGFSLYALDMETGETVWSHVFPTADKTLDWFVKGNELYLCDSRTTQVILDANTGEEIGSFNDSDSPWEYQAVTAGNVLFSENGGFYYLDGDLCYGISGQSLTETVLDQNQYSYNEDTELGNDLSFVVLSDGTIYISVGTSNGMDRLYRYDFDTKAEAASSTLTVWALGEYPTLQKTIRAYYKAYPEVRVEFETPDFSGSRTLNDVLTSMNTKLLAGEGPDVLILDGLDYESYMDKGVLADLTDIYEETSFVGGTVSSLLADNGTCYVIPARFSVPVIYGENLTLPSNLDKLAELVTSQKEGELPYTLFSKNENGSIWSVMLASSAPDLISTSGAWEEENLRQWLKAVKTICDSFNEDDLLDFGSTSSSWFDYGNSRPGITETEHIWSFGELQAANSELYAIETIPAATQDFTLEQNRTLENFTIAQFPGLTEGAYTPKILMAVSASSKNQENAKNFLRTALSMDVQQYTYGESCYYEYKNQDGTVHRHTYGDGMPVLQEAVDKQLEYFAPYAQEYGWDIEELRSLLESRTTPVLLSEDIQVPLEENIDAYLEGSVSLDDTIANLKKDLMLKLAEN